MIGVDRRGVAQRQRRRAGGRARWFEVPAMRRARPPTPVELWPPSPEARGGERTGMPMGGFICSY